MGRITNLFNTFSGSNKQAQSVSVSWSYVASIAGIALFSILIIGGLLWHLAYGIKPSPPKKLSLKHISNPAEITWQKDGSASIRSENITSAAAAIGYVHATNNPWQMMLWRQTAEGNLTAWFGPGLLQVDRLTKQLKIAAVAKATYENLSEDERRPLQAYADGVNAAVHQQNLLPHDDFAFLDVDIHPWKPWHTLVVERLFSWLTADLNGLSNDSLSSRTVLPALISSDETLHKFLQVHDFGYSYAGAWQTTDEQHTSYFYQRLIYGASAHSIVQEINFSLGTQSDLFVSTIPGTLVFLSGLGANHSWALLPASKLSIQHNNPGANPSISHERITNRDGTEFLATFAHYPGFLSLSADATSDSLFSLHWNGFLEGTDAPAFLNLLEGNKPDLLLLETNGLWKEGNRTVPLGEPAYTYSIQDGGILVASTPWSAFTASHIDSLRINQPAALNPKAWTTDCFSPWAAGLAPGFFSALTNTGQLDSLMYQDAFTYLRNWDYTFSSSSIGAAIFEAWLSRLGYSSAEERLDLIANPDTTELILTFKEAVIGLKRLYGPDLSKWRLEQTRPVLRYFPAWVADSLYSPDSSPLSQTNYAPLTFPGKGDVATLCWGSFSTQDYKNVSAQWETWSMQKEGKEAWYWRKQVTPDSFLERYLISNRPSVSFRFGPDKKPVVTHLQPGS